jgi:hypothetical protein
MPYFGTLYTSVSIDMDYGYSMGPTDNPSAKVVVANDQQFSNIINGQLVYNTAPSAADLTLLANVTSFYIPVPRQFKPTQGLVVTWVAVQDKIYTQTAMITDGNHTFLIFNYDVLPLNITSGYLGNGTNATFTPIAHTLYCFQVNNGPAVKKNSS